jgi:hypothetical protein
MQSTQASLLPPSIIYDSPLEARWDHCPTVLDRDMVSSPSPESPYMGTPVSEVSVLSTPATPQPDREPAAVQTPLPSHRMLNLHINSPPNLVDSGSTLGYPGDPATPPIPDHTPRTIRTIHWKLTRCTCNTCRLWLHLCAHADITDVKHVDDANFMLVVYN